MQAVQSKWHLSVQILSFFRSKFLKWDFFLFSNSGINVVIMLLTNYVCIVQMNVTHCDYLRYVMAVALNVVPISVRHGLGLQWVWAGLEFLRNELSLDGPMLEF